MRTPMFALTLAATLGVAGCGQEASEAAGGIAQQIEIKKQMEAKLGLTQIRSAIGAFRGEMGRPPKDLNELVSSGKLNALPTPPDGWHWHYNADGTVTAHGAH